ncbi:hypothetical protein BOTNAR_0483g00030 [Botryotinia narcissicola]|uniref:DUF1996 domain-containing protein n=1 Tax=Botryotinia narcissicola TaxID=278944 RepID=A0A4Z1HLX7_9HELO|nr:hypothetical protein BOTNAR_0483g00030 [Botryotinia narcissicola]
MVFSKLVLVSTFAASATAYSATARTFAVNHFYGTGPLLTARVDPIVNPGTVGTHVHAIQGGSAFGMTMGDTTALDDSNCTSSLVKNDKSNYWTPSLYFVDPNDPTNITAVPMFYMNVYYFFEPTTDKITAFQPGHRMLVGNAALRTPPAGGGGSIVDYSLGTPQTIQVTCPHTNYDTPSYPADSDGLHGPTKGNCPEGWIHTPHIFYEVYYNTPLFASQWTPGQGKQPFVLAKGDPTGYGFHADFISGWDVETLQQIIDNCDAGDSGMDKCPGLIGGLNDPTTSCTIKSPIDEIVNGTMSVLPGGNPIGQWGSGVASVASSVVASANSGIASQASSVAVGASSAVSSVVSGASSVSASVSNVASSTLGVATSAASISIPSISLPLYQAPTSTASQHSQTHTRSGASTKVAAASSAASEVLSSSVITSGGQVFTSIVTVHASTLIYKTVSVTAGQVLPTGSSVSSSTPAAISGYSYAGCYADQESSRALSGVTFADVGKGAVSNSACVAY